MVNKVNQGQLGRHDRPGRPVCRASMSATVIGCSHRGPELHSFISRLYLFAWRYLCHFANHVWLPDGHQEVHYCGTAKAGPRNAPKRMLKQKLYKVTNHAGLAGKSPTTFHSAIDVTQRQDY